jgi:hypothetical protein
MVQYPFLYSTKEYSSCLMELGKECGAFKYGPIMRWLTLSFGFVPPPPRAATLQYNVSRSFYRTLRTTSLVLSSLERIKPKLDIILIISIKDEPFLFNSCTKYYSSDIGGAFGLHSVSDTVYRPEQGFGPCDILYDIGLRFPPTLRILISTYKTVILAQS